MAKKIGVDLQNECIRQACAEVSDFLTGKNTSYDGSAFKEIVYGGKKIEVLDTINVRITDKLRRLQSSNPEFTGDDTELDLLGYLLLKRAVIRYQDTIKAEAKEERKRQMCEKAVELTNSPEVKKTRKRRVSNMDGVAVVVPSMSETDRETLRAADVTGTKETVSAPSSSFPVAASDVFAAKAKIDQRQKDVALSSKLDTDPAL